MRAIHLITLAALAAAGTAQAQAPRQYPPLSEYLMPRDAEVALASSAAPPNISGAATIKVLTPRGYVVEREGSNGFTCVVLRGWSAPMYTPAQNRAFVYASDLRSPICYNAVAARTVLAYQELRARLGMEGKNADQITAAVEAAYAHGVLPAMESGGFAYMYSADQNLGPGIGAYDPHLMLFMPYAENRMLGGNAPGGAHPFVADDAGTPFAVVIIPVDRALAIHSRR